MNELPLRHLGVLLNALAGGLYAFYFVMAITVLHLPPGRFPYVVSILGVIVMCALGAKTTTEGDRRTINIGYLVTLVNVLGGIGSVAIIVADWAGPESALWHFMNTPPFPVH